MARMMSWRNRIDYTTNWSVTVTAAMLSVSLSSLATHHGVLLFAMVLNLLLLVIESRRYRFFDVYRSRVRLLERNYYAAVFAGDQVSEADWMRKLAADLRMPRFYITLRQGMARRLRRNYIWLFLILLLAWFLKTTTVVLQTDAGKFEFIHSRHQLLSNAAIGYIPGWLVLTAVILFYGWLAYVTFKHYETQGELDYGQVHV
jgi:uncharacterized membrane protein